MDACKESRQRIVKREVSTKKNHLISLFNNFEVTILDKKKKYVDKLQSLISAWEQINTFVAETSSESPQPEFDSLFSHTLRLVLRADWRNVSKVTKTHLSNILQRIISHLTNGKRFFSILPQCRVLESVINDPWNHVVLKKIFHDEILEIDELIDYFHFENGKVIVIRLEILLESKCEDLANRLSKACLMTFNLTDPLELELNQNEVDYIIDIYLCSLYRAKNTKDIISEIKTFDINDGLYLLKRYNKQGGIGILYNENCKEARIWKCSRKVMELISSTLLANAVLQDNFDSSDIDILHDLIREWASVHTTSSSDIFSPVPLEMIWKCVLIARCSMCIYPFCSFLIECGGKQHDLNHVLRCLIRAINQNMNEIEQHRVCRNNEKLKFTHELLAKGFLLTAELFREYRNIFKECLLTAFSLTPTREGLQKLEDFVNNDLDDVGNPPRTSTPNTENEINIKPENASDNPTEQSVNIKTEEIAEEPSVTHAISKDVPIKQRIISNELNAILETMGVDSENNGQIEIKTELNTSSSSLNETIKGTAPAYITEVESIKLEDSIKTDLNSILRYQRHHTLTWDFEWPILKVNCEKYHEMFEKRGFDEVELKYLELDYNQFKNYPVEYEDNTGIEKGYEHFITNEVEESDGEYGYRPKVAYTSDESDYNEDYSRKKRKKIRSKSDDDDHDWRHKTTTKKKRPKPKVKMEITDTQDENSVDSLPNGDAVENTTQLPSATGELVEDGTQLPTAPTNAVEENQLPAVKIIFTKKKLRGRPRSMKPLSDSETNADSQSENQPPEQKDKGDALADDMITDGNVRPSGNNLQLLRQFRISLSRPLISEENATNIARQVNSEVHNVNTPAVDNLGKPTNRNFVDGDSAQLRICIPKCDGYPYFNNVQMLDLESMCENRCTTPDKESDSQNLLEKLQPSEKSSSLKKSNGSVETRDVIDCTKTTDSEENASSNRNSIPKKRTKIYPKTSIHAKRFSMNRLYRKKLYGSVITHSKPNVEGIDDLISEIFPEFSSNGSWQTNGNFDENFREQPPPPVVPFQQPTPTLSEFLDTTLDSTFGPTSTNEATFVSSTVELPSHALPINPVADGSSLPSCNELTPLQAASSPPVEPVFSYLTSSINSIDNMFSYPSTICNNQQLTVQQPMPDDNLSMYDSSAPEILDISTSLAEPPYNSYSNYQQQVPDDAYSVSSSYDAVTTPSSSSSTAPALSSPFLVDGVQTPAVRSSDGAISSLTRSSALKPNSKLRAALQKPNLHLTVSLPDIGCTKKVILKEEQNDSVAVNQILDKYRDAMDKHPELGHVPARRKRIQDQAASGNPPKRPRRSKKYSAVASSNQEYPSMPLLNQIQVPSAMVNSSMLGVQVPSHLQQQPPISPTNNFQVLEPNQANNVYRPPMLDAAHKLPSCLTTGISSQSYGDVGGCENEVTSNMSTYESSSNSQVMSMNGYADRVSCVPSHTNDTYWSDSTTLINLDTANMPVNANNSCDDLKVPIFVATVYSDNTGESNNPGVCISIPEDQYWIEGTQLQQSNDDLYSKNQNDNAADDTPNIQCAGDSVVTKQDATTFINGEILNNLFYGDSNYSAEMNNYGT